MKLLPLVMIPYKSRKYQAILDLSFTLMMVGYNLPSVNEATEHIAAKEVMDQIGIVLPRLIKTLALAPLD